MLKLLATFFAAHAIYSIWAAFASHTFMLLTGGILSAIASVGLWRHRQWSQYFVYLISFLVGVYSAWYMWALVELGWPYEDGVRSFVSLIPGGLVLLFAIGASVHVFRTFRRKS
jgi:hypothetical protein